MSSIWNPRQPDALRRIARALRPSTRVALLPPRPRSFATTLAGLVLFVVASDARGEDGFALSGTLDFGYYRWFDGSSGFGSISRSHIALAGATAVNPDLSLTLRVALRFFLRDPDSGRYLVNEDPKYPASGEGTVGVKGGFGQLRIGRAPTAVWSNDWHFDAWYNFDSIASPAWWMWHLNSPADPNASARNASFARLNNGVFYASPVFAGGFSVDASFGARTRIDDVRHSTSIALKFNQAGGGGLIGRENTPTGTSFQIVAGRLDFGPVSVMGAFDDERIRDGSRNRSATLSTRYGVGRMSYLLGYGHQVDYRANFQSAGLAWAHTPELNLYASYGRQGPGFWGGIAARQAFGAGVNYRF